MSGDGDSAIARRGGKSEAAFRTISEVAEDLDVPQHVLRFWESRFPQVRPLKRGGGRRYYRPEDVALLRRIRDLLYSEGYTIKGVQKLLREGAGGREAQPDQPKALSLPLLGEDVEDEGDAAGPGPDEGVLAEEPDEAEDFADEEADESELDGALGLDDAEVDSQELSAEDALAPSHPSALTPAVRREMEDLLDELEQLRRLLDPRP